MHFGRRRRLRSGDTTVELTGRLTANPRGFGFVVTEEQGPDVFISAKAMGAALHGDKVRVRARRSRRGLDGWVLRVLERGIRHVGGTLHIAGRMAWIAPEDERLRGPVAVTGAIPKGAKAGQQVVAEITRYPDTSAQNPEARVVDILEPGRRCEFELRKITLQEGVEEDFSEETKVQAAALPPSVSREDKAGREDLRALDLITIDPEDARDHDDAVWATRTRDAGYRAIIAIADVSHYVPEGSALDRDALSRGCSIYLPQCAIPMLPSELSCNLASLRPNRDRLTLAVEVNVGPRGAIRNYRFIEGVMRSRARLTYGGVARALGLCSEARAQRAAREHRPLLQTLFELAAVLRSARMRRGALMFDLPEAEVELDPQTREPLDIRRARRHPGVAQAYNLIEELMLLANQVVATELAKRRICTIYRVHPAPEPEPLQAFAQVANSLGHSLSPDAGRRPQALARFVRQIEGTPQAHLLAYLLLRSLQQASYDTDNIGHFALATSYYLHFTSPIRRYPDLAVHRIVRCLARGQPVDDELSQHELSAQAVQSTLAERRALKVEREVVDLYRALLMQGNIGETFDATICSVTDHGFYCTLDAPFVDVLCRLSSLPADRYELRQHGSKLVGTYTERAFALGDRIRVRIIDVSVARRQVLAVPENIDQPWSGPRVCEPKPLRPRRRSARRRGRQ